MDAGATMPMARIAQIKNDLIERFTNADQPWRLALQGFCDAF
jgi:hypothetical protein